MPKQNGYLKNYSILIVDDERMTHILLKAMLFEDFNLYFAKDAQEGIDILSEHPINLILLDVQMPDISGIELLESLMIDTVLQNIPVIIMTGKATEDLEKKALDLGAVQFIDKEKLFSNKQNTLKQIERKISAEIRSPKIYLGYKENFKKILKALLQETVQGDFITACRKLGVGIMKTFQLNYLSIWTVKNKKTNQIVSLGEVDLENLGPEELINEKAFQEFAEKRKPYLSNHPESEKKGLFPSTSLKSGLSAEIGIPLYAISKSDLINNNMKLPPNTPIFGFVIMKRNRVFTTKEYKMITKFTIQAGTILYGLYKNLFQQLDS